MAKMSLDVAVGILRPLLMVVLVSILVATTRADDNSTNTTTTSVTSSHPSNCSTRCGNITFEYPFDVGEGCFRPGFELTCINTTSNSLPKLFLSNETNYLEVVDNIYATSVYLFVKAPIAILGANENFSYASWTAPQNALYSNYYNSLQMDGCNAVASLVDPASNQTLATCNTNCLDPNQVFCIHEVGGGIRSFGIQLSRTNESDRSSIVKASFGWGGEAYLFWFIPDQRSCNEAENDEQHYACLSQSSDCVTYNSPRNISTGYWCACQNDFAGNPYLPNGCRDLSVKTAPLSNCTRNCGNVTIPFPFGLEEGCYRSPSFALSCDETLNPPILHFNISDNETAQVKGINLQEGQMELSVERGPHDEQNHYQGIEWHKPFVFLTDRAVVQWVIEYANCAVAKQNSTNFACRMSSECVETIMEVDNAISHSRTGYICRCLYGFEGNPYLDGGDGCKDINECEMPKKYGCHGHCINTVGSFTCTSKVLLGLIIIVRVDFGTLLLAIISFFAIRKWNKISQKRTRERYFRENHGLLLKQLIASNENSAEKIKIFSLKEVEKATNNFDVSRILGQGGHGTVYKGILSDQRVVAIKQSKIKKKSEIDQFLNEVTILSQINHRNIVKLFGCCLEIEVPLLVYEFISNGTLLYHLHSPNRKSTLSWKDRLRIAAEAA